MQRFKSNGKIIQFENYGWNPNSLFAFLLNPNGRTCKSYASNLRCKEKDVAAQWRSTAIPVTFPELKMPQEFFFLTELHFEAVVVIFLMTAIPNLTLQPLESAKHLSVDI